MRKFKRTGRIVSFLLVATMLFGCLGFSAMGAENSESKVEDRASREARLNLAHNRILRSFGVSGIRFPEEEEAVVFAEQPDYGDMYAGAYLDEKTGQLVVLLVSHTVERADKASGGFVSESSTKIEQAKSELLELTRKAKEVKENDIIFREAKYTYQYLNDLMDMIAQEIQDYRGMPEEESFWTQVVGAALLEDKNCIQVFILDISDEKIARFKNEIDDSDVFIFHGVHALGVTEATTVRSGCKLNAGNTMGTIGYRAEGRRQPAPMNMDLLPLTTPLQEVPKIRRRGSTGHIGPIHST